MSSSLTNCHRWMFEEVLVGVGGVCGTGELERVTVGRIASPSEITSSSVKINQKLLN